MQKMSWLTTGGRSATPLLGDLIEAQQVIWVLYRGDMRASIGLPEQMDTSPFVSASEPATENVDLEDALAQTRRFIGLHEEWEVVVSIPMDLGAADQACDLALRAGARELALDEGRVLKELGMEIPLGKWADVDQACIFCLRGGVAE